MSLSRPPKTRTRHRKPQAARRSVAHNFYVQNCSLPLEAALALLPILAVPAAEIARDANFRVMLLLATAFLDTARAALSRRDFFFTRRAYLVTQGRGNT